MFEGDRRRGVPGSDVVTKSKTQFDLPIQKDRNGRYKLNDMLLLTSMTSDFFIEEADEWRDDAWRMMSKRKDLTFEILTKRPHRIMDCLPDDWGDGYPNVRMSVSAEDQDAWDERVPILLSIPAVKRDVYIAPIIGPIDVGEMLSRGGIDAVYVGGEYCSKGARPCDFEWVKGIREECVKYGTTFIWRNTGTYLLCDREVSRTQMESYYSAHQVKNYFDLFTGMFCQPDAPSYSTFSVKDQTITVNSYTADADGNSTLFNTFKVVRTKEHTILTDLEDVRVEQLPEGDITAKVLYKGQIILMRNGVAYDVLGHVVK